MFKLLTSKSLRSVSSGRAAFGTTVNVQRSSRFATLGDKDISFFDSILKKNQIITDADDLASNNQDWTKKFKG